MIVINEILMRWKNDESEAFEKQVMGEWEWQRRDKKEKKSNEIDTAPHTVI